MITLKETKQKITAAPRWWKVAFYDFVDDFRRHKNLTAISESFPASDDKIDALLASTAEFLCDELNLGAPDWLEKIPASREPFFVSGLENLKATAIVESPLRFRFRKVFVTGDFLSRV